jgi:hypothetical protein
MVDSSNPKEELIKAQSYIANRELKNTEAVLVRLHGKYAIAKKRKQVIISTGRIAIVLPMK